MSNPKMHLVCTTIRTPVFLESYLRNFQHYGHTKDVMVWVIGDRKTPADTEDYIARLRGEGLNVSYWDCKEQTEWLTGQHYQELGERIPWNSDNRRNVGYLLALNAGADVIVSVDDDNYARDDSDFYAGHSEVGTKVGRLEAHAISGWYNTCDHVVIKHGHISPFARGLPIDAMPPEKVVNVVLTEGKPAVSVAANTGIWTGSPDVGAETWAAIPGLEAVFPGHYRPNVYLAPGTWCPLNTQNTSIARRCMPAYYYWRMGWRFPGARLDRYGDIWQGYFLQRCMQHLGDHVTVGSPVVRHCRNEHNVMADLRAEFWGMILNPYVSEMLRHVKTAGNTYSEVAINLAHDFVIYAGGVTYGARVSEVQGYLEHIADTIRIWADICRDLGCEK